MFLKDPDNITSLDISESELFPILSILDIGVMITNDKGEILYYNPVHAKMDGFTAEEVIGCSILDVYHLDEDSSLVMRCLRTSRAIVECPVIYKTKNDRIVDTIHNVFPLIKDGKVTGVISFIKDYQMVDAVTESSQGDATQLTFTGDTDFSLDDIIGSSMKLLEAVNRARMAAQTDSPVLLYGETGTGKELFAQSIHNLSNRKKSRYIAVNCAAIPENLLEGILFGTSKGAFTGALDKAGLFERANGGTLFLDEVNSMSQEMQPKLLRAIQEKRVCRIGSHREVKLDVKIISSMNTNFEQAVLSGVVRQDLLYRLSVVYISLPPLRERKEDIPTLTNFFLEKYNRKLKKNVSGVSPDVMAVFMNHDWPGNVRELENIIEGSMNMVGRDRLIEKWHLISGFTLENTKAPPEAAELPLYRESFLENQLSPEKVPQNLNGNSLLSAKPEKNAEIQEILEALHDADGNISDAAVIMGISRQTFYRKVKKFNITIPKKSSDKLRQEIIDTLLHYKGNMTRSAEALGMSRQLLAYKVKKMKIDRQKMFLK